MKNKNGFHYIFKSVEENPLPPFFLSSSILFCSENGRKVVVGFSSKNKFHQLVRKQTNKQNNTAQIMNYVKEKMKLGLREHKSPLLTRLYFGITYRTGIFV